MSEVNTQNILLEEVIPQISPVSQIILDPKFLAVEAFKTIILLSFMLKEKYGTDYILSLSEEIPKLLPGEPNDRDYIAMKILEMLQADVASLQENELPDALELVEIMNIDMENVVWRAALLSILAQFIDENDLTYDLNEIMEALDFEIDKETLVLYDQEGNPIECDVLDQFVLDNTIYTIFLTEEGTLVLYNFMDENGETGWAIEKDPEIVDMVYDYANYRLTHNR